MLIQPFYLIKNYILSLLPFKTVGARALVIKKNSVLLIKHTYVSGWHTIGGAVDKRETPEQAIKRELMEEVSVEAKSLRLFNIYHNLIEKRDDYVAFYICDDFTEHAPKPNKEIQEKKWFSFDQLPTNITKATHQRIKEYQGKIDILDTW
jgi:ADP-ribose pyrophosphatase YjhB (NUDIX family)